MVRNKEEWRRMIRVVDPPPLWDKKEEKEEEEEHNGCIKLFTLAY